MVDIITSRIKQIIGDGFAPDSLPQTPSKIEQESFNRIEKALNLIGTPDSHPLIVKKIVHTVGDLAIASEVYAPSEAVDAGVKAIRDGKNIVTDVEMVKAGIRGKKLSSFGSDIFCLIKENKIAEDASKQGTTRAALAIKTAAEMAEDGIIAIGNAPTALFEVCRLLKAKTIKPALVIGAPVGFVGCSESKEVLMRSGVPCIVVKGARGGSPVAAAIVNALIDLADM
ncbi:MAG: precorrin-8X methylmutase [Actinobacteria bacterium]|nr:precorrin-8X methylmutase [Actinomycetota bacterium]